MKSALDETLFAYAELAMFVMAITAFLLFLSGTNHVSDFIKNNEEVETGVYKILVPENEAGNIVKGTDVFHEILAADSSLTVYIDNTCLSSKYVGTDLLLDVARAGDAELLYDYIPSLDREYGRDYIFSQSGEITGIKYTAA